MWIHHWPQPQAFLMFKRQGAGGGLGSLSVGYFLLHCLWSRTGGLSFPFQSLLQRPCVWGNPQTTIKPFISGPSSHHTPSCSNQVYKAFPLFYISWINCKICQPLPVPLVLSWEVPLPSVGSTRLLWFLTGVTWKCTVGTHSLFHGQISVSLGRWPHLLRNCPAKLRLKSRFVETSFDPNSNVSVSVTQKEKEEWGGLQSKQLSYLATGQNLPHYRG